MKKRILSACLAALLLSSTVIVPADAVADENSMAQTLAALDIMVGTGSGNLELGRNVTRSEFVKMSVAATPAGAGVGAASVSPYPDVPASHWSAGYVHAAVQGGLVNGYLDGTFRPTANITLAEGVTIVLRLLGYQNSDFSGVYPSGHMAKYQDLKLDNGVTTTNPSAPLTRQDCQALFYNLLTTPSKTTGMAHITSLGHTLNAAGEVDVVALINSTMEGPLVATEGWSNQLPFALSGATVYRNGVPSSTAAIAPYDIVYYSNSMTTLWVYNNRVTGTYQSATPSAASPSSVTVAGKQYPIETAGAALVLSNLGSVRTGDLVTLLLGRNGGVAAVLPGDKADTTLYGMVTATGATPYTDQNGNTFTTPTVTFSATDGNSYTYPTTLTSLKQGNLVQVNNGTVSTLTATSLSGKMSDDGSKLGSVTLADDVEILDTRMDGSANGVIYPHRLAGLSLSASQVRFCQYNTQGQLSHLILKDVTGDLYQYGVVTSVNEVSAAFTAIGQYSFDIGGVPQFYASGNSVFGVTVGPCQITLKNGTADSMRNLPYLTLTAINGTTATTAKGQRTVAENVAVYELVNGDYYYSSLAHVSDGDFTLTGYYDKSEDLGGRIRVIVARASL